MHDEGCSCALCHEHSAHEQEEGLQKLAQAVQTLRGPSSELWPAERHEFDSAEVVQLDAGFRLPVPAVMFHPPSRLEKLKAGFTYGYRLENSIEEIAASLRGQMREHLSQ